MRECSDILKVMGLEAFGGSPGVLEKLIRPEDLSGQEAPAALLRSLGFEKVTVAYEQATGDMNRARLRELGFDLGARAEGGVSDDGGWFERLPAPGRVVSFGH